MNEKCILSADLHTICYESVELYKKRKSYTVLCKNVINLLCKYVLPTCNTYIPMFLLNRLENLKECDNNSLIYKKILAEIYLFLGVCNKKRNKHNYKKIKDPEATLVKHLSSNRNMDIVLNCVWTLHKDKSDLLWKAVHKISQHHAYINALYALYNLNPHPLLLCEAYHTLDNRLVLQFDSSAYNEIILQCLIKLNYIYEELELVDKNDLVYFACLNFIPKLIDQLDHKDTYIHDDTVTKHVVISKYREAVHFEKKKLLD